MNLVGLPNSSILIVDFGSQYTQLIARRVRELGVYCEIIPYDAEEKVKKFKAKGIILSGGPETVLNADSPRIPKGILESNCPILGICYGMQALAYELGGQVEPSKQREFGYARVMITTHTDSKDKLLSDLQDGLDSTNNPYIDVWMSHGDKVFSLPPDFVSIAETENSPIAAMASYKKNIYGVQFHPEVTHTKQGKDILRNFIKDICDCETNWVAHNIADTLITEVKQQIGNGHVILGLSGGVDSSVVAALLNKAIGNQLLCIFVDTGLLRKGDVDKVMKVMAQHLGVSVICVDAKTRFLTALKGKSCPEEKRKIIGKIFIDVFEEEALKHKEAKWLAQGTIYSDVIESAGNQDSKGHVIKSHHNVGGLPEEMSLKLIEPLRMLFKDEVRALGIELGLPSDMVNCHPFPGPGLGVRVLGEIKPEYLEILRAADKIFIDSLRDHGLYDKVSQAFSVFLPVKSVAVMGDGRAYEYVVALRAVETTDFMTAHWARLPYDFLAEVSSKIINEIAGISRVVYDISGKPPSTIEWE